MLVGQSNFAFKFHTKASLILYARLLSNLENDIRKKTLFSAALSILYMFTSDRIASNEIIQVTLKDASFVGLPVLQISFSCLVIFVS